MVYLSFVKECEKKKKKKKEKKTLTVVNAKEKKQTKLHPSIHPSVPVHTQINKRAVGVFPLPTFHTAKSPKSHFHSAIISRSISKVNQVRSGTDLSLSPSDSAPTLPNPLNAQPIPLLLSTPPSPSVYPCTLHTPLPALMQPVPAFHLAPGEHHLLRGEDETFPYTWW